jgi:hypothetical protein
VPARAFSGEVDTGSPSENAIKQRGSERNLILQNGIRSGDASRGWQADDGNDE